MPEVLLNQSPARPVVRSRARWTVTGSCLLHALLVVTILIAPVVGQTTLPPFTRPVVVVFAGSRLVPPPPVVPPLPGQHTAPVFDPTTVPVGLHDETPVAPAPVATSVPGGLDLPMGRSTSILYAGNTVAPATVAP